jgi:hypothetical protein
MIDTQTATAPPPLPVSRPAFFLTTNHYPLTTAFPAHTHSMIKTGTWGTRKQASEGASKEGVSARRAESRELKPEDSFSLFRFLTREVRSRRNPTLAFFPSAANPASSADSLAFPLPCSLVPLVPRSLLLTHPPPPQTPPPPPFRDPTPHAVL